MSILIRNGTILTVDLHNTILQPGWVRVEGNRIAGVGKEPGPVVQPGDRELDASGRLVLPGLINAHAHLTDSLVRGLGADLPLLEWLRNLIWPFFAHASSADVCAGARLGCLEAIQSGTTLVVENYYSTSANAANVDALAETLASSGLRAVLVRGYHDNPRTALAPFIEETRELLTEYERIIGTWNGKADGRLMTWLGPVDLLSSVPSSIRAVHDLALRHGVGMHSHVAETESELALIRAEYGEGYVRVLDSLGVLDSRFSCAHAVWVDEEEIGILVKRGAGVVHNPVSNMYLGAGIAPVPEMLKKGVTVALGTDGACCNNTLDMIETMKTASLIHKVAKCDPAAISALEVLRMATINGAKLLGLDHEIGSIEVGKRADLVLLDLQNAHTTPVFDPVASLVYSARASDVETVMVDGRLVMNAREVTVFDEGEVLERAQQSATALVQRVPELAHLANEAST